MTSRRVGIRSIHLQKCFLLLVLNFMKWMSLKEKKELNNTIGLKIVNFKQSNTLESGMPQSSVDVVVPIKSLM